MPATLGGLYCRRNLSVRDCKQAGDLLGQGLVGGKTGKLALPEIEIAPRQSVEIARGIVVSGGHDAL